MAFAVNKVSFKKEKKVYKLGKGSNAKLKGVDKRMVEIVKEAIKITEQDFSVICGLRTMKEQEELVARGASQLMKSKHLDGLAVDLMAYLPGNGDRWELQLYFAIADAMKEASKTTGHPIRWGAAWNVTLTDWDSSAEDAMNNYIDLRRSQKRPRFIDAPHFELLK